MGDGLISFIKSLCLPTNSSYNQKQAHELFGGGKMRSGANKIGTQVYFRTVKGPTCIRGDGGDDMYSIVYGCVA